MRFANMEYLVLEATRDNFGGEEIPHDIVYNQPTILIDIYINK